MTKAIILSILFLINSGFFAFCQLNQFSKDVQKINDDSFDLISSDPAQAKRLNLEAFEKIQGHKKNIDPIVHSNIYSISGTLAQYYTGDYEKALNDFQICLSLRKKAPNNITKLADIHLNIANLFYEAGNNKKAIYYYKQSLYYNSKVNRDPIELVDMYNGLSQAYEAINLRPLFESWSIV